MRVGQADQKFVSRPNMDRRPGHHSFIRIRVGIRGHHFLA